MRELLSNLGSLPGGTSEARLVSSLLAGALKLRRVADTKRRYLWVVQQKVLHGVPIQSHQTIHLTVELRTCGLRLIELVQATT
jgi:hypothetical protein